MITLLSVANRWPQENDEIFIRALEVITVFSYKKIVLPFPAINECSVLIMDLSNNASYFA